MFNTFIINIYGGPGTGKSTAAAYIFTKLKMLGVNAELVTEYAKDKTWEQCQSALKCEYYINAKQAYRINRVYGQVEAIVTDSPIILGAVYATDNDAHVRDAAIAEDAKYKADHRIDVVLERDYKYEQIGRNQSENEAKAIDDKIVSVLRKAGIKYTKIHSKEYILDTFVKDIFSRIMKVRDNTPANYNRYDYMSVAQLKQEISMWKRLTKDIVTVLGNDPYMLSACADEWIAKMVDSEEQEKMKEMSNGIMHRLLSINPSDWRDDPITTIGM